MATTQSASTFVCSCFFTDNIFIHKYKLHVSFHSKEQFLESYSKILRNRGCVTQQQFADVIEQVEREVSRRQQLGQTSVERRRQIEDTYSPLHSDVYTLQEEFLHPDFLSLVSMARTDGATAESLMEHMECIGAGVYAMPVFQAAFCHRLQEELDNIEASPAPKGRPNTMNRDGVLLGEFGFSAGLLDPLRQRYLSPLCALLFPTWGGGDLDSHRAFTVTYQPGRDLDLACHYDNAEVTLNVALGGDFSGGALYFLPMSGEAGVEENEDCEDAVGGGSEDGRGRRVRWDHRAGWGVLHRGAQLHGAGGVTGGRRTNVVMWMRASSVRNSHCPMCGRLPSLRPGQGLDDGFRPSPLTPLQQPGQVDVCCTL